MFGIGLRTPHIPGLLAKPIPAIDFLEAISENFMGLDRAFGGRPFENILRIRGHYPIALHGVSLSVGSVDPLNLRYLKRLKRLIAAVEPLWVSDHLCWTGTGGENLHDLLPLPYTSEAIRHVSDRILRVQEFLGRRLVIENVSSYIGFEHSEMTEWEFLVAVVERADCEILLDINNIFVSGINHNFDPMRYLRAIPKKRIRQFHLAGHVDKGEYRIDTHDQDVCDSVWDLYLAAVKRWGNIPVILERDANIPPLNELLMELNHARAIAKSVGRTQSKGPQSQRSKPQISPRLDAVDHRRSAWRSRGLVRPQGPDDLSKKSAVS